jgi:medium-chain acyl-[acyl-carrier-protein] hydrolase
MSAPPWFLQLAPPPGGSVATAPADLFCFPHAGGSAAHFRGLAAALAGAYDIWAANLPGHGARWQETPRQALAGLAGEVTGAFLAHMTLEGRAERPFAFLGLSVGARLAFEVARELRRRGERLPFCLYAVACPAPQWERHPRGWFALPQEALLTELQRHNGLPEALLAEPDLLALLLPALRADLRMMDTAGYRAEAPFTFPIFAWGGTQDRLVSVEEVEAWRAQTNGLFERILFAGDHFFLYAAPTAVADAIRDTAGRISELP